MDADFKTSGKTKLYYNGIPKNLLKKQESSKADLKVDKDKLNYSKSIWLQKRGFNILQMDRNSEEEARKLFRYIDHDNDGYITKQKIKMFLAFIEGEFSN